ncbi:YidH family protein [Ferviditalea candida]|uniref:DUF202 domain-containing protein n=1 Tax=Ferviditalea candida TaxID=3108399 RepID=A0ABU5ZIJ0_9BACL|nr:DUF202 domain-containing protein [Paenibacillaceae bacterium T2]
MKDRDKTVDSVDSRYIQQHLANERTFLAWVRTGISMVGLGFLAAGIIFRATPAGHSAQLIAIYVGIFGVLLGGVITVLAGKDYFTKRRDINGEMFRSPGLIVWISLAGLGLVDLFLILLVIILFVN